MSDTTTKATKVGTVNLLDVITRDRKPPEGCDAWAIRSVHPDFMSSRGFRWPYPGQWAKASGPFRTANTDGCPLMQGDGICAATTWEGMASGGIPALTLLLVAYFSADILGRDEGEGKFRARRMLVVDLIDGGRLLRERGSFANLRYADLRYADLRSADGLAGVVSWRDARVDSFTRWPAGFAVPVGVIVD